MRGIKDKEVYQDIRIKQVKGITKRFDKFFNMFKFDNIFEIGTGNGGFSIYLAKKAKDMGSTFTTVDIIDIDYDIKKRIESFGGEFINKDINKFQIDDIFKEHHRNLLLIDGAEKVPPFKHFAKHLQTMDYILVHDYYGEDEGDEYGTFTLRDVVDTIIENELIIKCNEFFDKTLWLCVTKY